MMVGAHLYRVASVITVIFMPSKETDGCKTAHDMGTVSTVFRHAQFLSTDTAQCSTAVVPL